MKTKKRLTALALAAVMGLTAFLPAARADAVELQPLPFDTYVNGSLVSISNSLLYQGHTYVQLRELSNVTNMGIEFTEESTLVPGGGLPIGISIDQPTFVYVKDGVPDRNHLYGSENTFKGVDITTLFARYQTRKGNFDYAFDSMTNSLIVPDGAGTKTIALSIVQSNGKIYVSVDEFRDKIQPYLVDICMQ